MDKRSREKKRRKEMRRRRKLYPKVLVVQIPVNEMAMTVADVLDVYNAFQRQQNAPTIYRPTGPHLQCFANVREQVSRYGGEMVGGWITEPGSPAEQVGENCFAHVRLVGHAVWKDENGKLFELTQGNRDHMFIQDSRVDRETGAGMSFFDSYEHVNESYNVGTLALMHASVPSASLRLHRYVIDINERKLLEYEEVDVQRTIHELVKQKRSSVLHL